MTGRARVKAPALSLPQMPVILRGQDATSTAELNRENYVAHCLQVASMVGDRRLDQHDRAFAQRMALLLAQKLIPNASAIDQIDRAEDRRIFRELSGLSVDDLLKMAQVTPTELTARAKASARVIDISSLPSSALASAELADKMDEASARPAEGSECYSIPLHL